MNCLNGARFLREAIDSIFSQTYTNWEIIFWDNASKDTTSEIAKSYEKYPYTKTYDCSSNFAPITLFKYEEMINY